MHKLCHPDRMRPQTLDQVIGQRHIIGEGKALQNIILSGKIPNLIFYGPSGVGKTHLMLAIKNHLKKNNPYKKIEYIRSEEFTNQLIQALQEGKLGIGSIDDFRNKYRNADVLLIDDIHFIAGKEQTQEEFFNTFNALFESSKQIEKLKKYFGTIFLSRKRYE